MGLKFTLQLDKDVTRAILAIPTKLDAIKQTGDAITLRLDRLLTVLTSSDDDATLDALRQKLADSSAALEAAEAANQPPTP